MGGIESFRRALLLFVWRITINNEYNKARLNGSTAYGQAAHRGGAGRRAGGGGAGGSLITRTSHRASLS
jgi:hypothetical protein